MRYLFSGEPGRPSNKIGYKLEGLIRFLRKRESEDLDLFNDILPKLIEWKFKKTGSKNHRDLQLPHNNGNGSHGLMQNFIHASVLIRH